MSSVVDKAVEKLSLTRMSSDQVSPDVVLIAAKYSTSSLAIALSCPPVPIDPLSLRASYQPTATLPVSSSTSSQAKNWLAPPSRKSLIRTSDTPGLSACHAALPTAMSGDAASAPQVVPRSSEAITNT